MKRVRTSERPRVIDLTLHTPSPPDTPQDDVAAVPSQVCQPHATFATSPGLAPQQQQLSTYATAPHYCYPQYFYQTYHPQQPCYAQQQYHSQQQPVPQQPYCPTQQNLHDVAADEAPRRHFPGFVPAGIIQSDVDLGATSCPAATPPAPASPLSQPPHLPKRPRGRPTTKRAPKPGSEHRQLARIAPKPIIPVASAPADLIPDLSIPGPADIIIHLTPYQPQPNFFWNLPMITQQSIARLWQLFKRKTIIPRTGPNFWSTIKAMEGMENEQLLKEKCLYVLLTQVGGASLWTKDAPGEYACLGCTDGRRP